MKTTRISPSRHSVFRYLVGLLALLSVLLLPLGTTHAQQAESIKAGDLVTLKGLGFSESQLKTELMPLKGKFQASEAELTALRNAGLSDEFVRFVRSLAPKLVMDNQALAKAIADGESTTTILNRIAAAERQFDTSATAILALNKQAAVAPAIIKAMIGKALTIDDIKSLVTFNASPDDLSILVDMLGMQKQPLQPTEALALTQAGVPASLIRQIRESSVASPEKPANKQVALSADAFERFDHVTDLFSISYPRDWFFETSILNGSVVYFASPQRRVADPATVDTAIALGMEPLSRENQVTATQAVNNYNALVREAISGYAPEGDVKTFEHHGRKAASQRFVATIDGQAVQGLITAVLGKQYLYFLSVHSPSGKAAELSPVYSYVADNLRVEPRRDAIVTGEKLNSQSVVSRYEDAIVQVEGWNNNPNQKAIGTGFFVRRDGYLVTNAHVVLDLKTGEGYQNLRVVWPDRMNRDPEPAELVAAEDLFAGRSGGLSIGNDMAVLRITSPKPLSTIPLTPVEDVSLGDEIVIIGYPLSGKFGSKLETTVTSGVVTRFQRREDDSIHTIVSDAIASGGNSGGPVISLRTGGVIGLLSGGSKWHEKEAKAARYSGILPTSMLTRFFPEYTLVTAERALSMTFVDSYDLALRAFESGWAEGAGDVIGRAIQRRPQDANGYSLQGQILLTTPDGRANPKPALDAFRRALDIDREHVPTLLARSGLEMMRDDAIAALRYIDRALAAEPDSWLIHYQRARINIALERFDTALRDLATAQKASGELIPQPFSLAGYAHYEKKQYEEGKSLYEKAVAIAPLDVEARLGIGQYYLHKDQVANALIEFDKLNTEVPRNPLVLAYTGHAYYLQENYPRAKQHLWDSFLRYNKLWSVTREEAPAFLYQALADASRKDRDPFRASTAYTRLLARHGRQTGAEQSVVAHEYLAAQAQEKHAEVERMHLVFASRIAREESAELRKRVATPLDKLKRGQLSMDNVVFMDTQRNYAPEMTAAIILDDEATLGFSVPGSVDRRGKPDQARSQWIGEMLNKRGLSFTVVNALLKKTASAKTSRQPTKKSERISLLGEWKGQQQGDEALIFRFASQQGRQFSLFASKGNQRNLLDQGTWSIGNNGYALILTGQQGAFEIPVSTQKYQGKDALLMTMGGQQHRYLRIK